MSERCIDKVLLQARYLTKHMRAWCQLQTTVTIQQVLCQPAAAWWSVVPSLSQGKSAMASKQGSDRDCQSIDFAKECLIASHTYVVMHTGML